MLFVAEYETEAWILLDAENAEHATAMLEGAHLARPKCFHEVPTGLVMLELYAEDEDSRVAAYAGLDEIPNPANHSQIGMAFEPLEATAALFNAMLVRAEAEAEQLPVATAPTEPASPLSLVVDNSETES